ncbi:aspartic peptidase domain-containing protein [Desarmillaria tabescens]|uniref:Aspartic peptidase domain-containing protein n=1 Tax=Armillaria tabescens TaxID=1929756 RepID=A0AA39NEM1_ARMTA|nr:aspartic peptidase domain-containing protein [Desarmillaria tabescens]KAK0464236.1 aspartic peptidase domain-containing protein [Desarmillaria tabescens]
MSFRALPFSFTLLSGVYNGGIRRIRPSDEYPRLSTTTIATTTALLTFLYLTAYSSGLELKIEGRRNLNTRHELLRRGNITGTSPLSDTADMSYYTTLKLGREVFSALVDTGSVMDSIDAGATSGVTYAIGGAKGPIKTSTLEFSRYTVRDQAFMEVTPDTDNKKGKGVIGLGPTSGSNIYNTLNTSAGFAVLDRIFLQNTSTPNYLTVLLGRTEDPAEVVSGEISIGELLDGYSHVESQPRLEVIKVPVNDYTAVQHFQVLLDQDGLLGLDGQPVSITTKVDRSSNSKQATVVIDCGFSLSQVPRTVADAIYSRFFGAEYLTTAENGEFWIVPCGAEINITFKFGGNSIHIHPLGATMDPSILGYTGLVNSKNQPLCIGSFQPISSSASGKTYDMILGMSFLRNVYAAFNFGDFVAGGNDTSNRGDPYLQFLSTTDPIEGKFRGLSFTDEF